MTFKISHSFLKNYLNFYYEHLPKIDAKNKDEQGLDLDIYKSTLKIKTIAKENPQPL